jgi:hypothetical protein
MISRAGGFPALGYGQVNGALAQLRTPLMDISGLLSTDLTEFLTDLDPAGPEVLQALSMLRRDLTVAVPSFQALRLAFQLEGVPIALTVADGVRPPVTTMRLPLWWLSMDQDASSITFYAAVPGAFVDLAADLTHTLGLDANAVTLDGLGPEILALGLSSGLTGLAGFTAVNRAIGMLMAGGFDIDDARAELAARAARTGLTLVEVAERQVAAWPHRAMP